MRISWERLQLQSQTVHCRTRGNRHPDDAVERRGEQHGRLLGNAVRMLAERPDLQEHLRQNPDQIATFAEEALRIDLPSAT